ncbi:MAG: hypothetical protein K2O98_04375 [Lachnospiraceae bacterium]|nr:hypothetical protein [Lachnospiraceae bacterium]
MGYSIMSAWDIVKRFLIGWTVVFGILVLISCVKYWDFITTALADQAMALFNAVMPLILIVYVLFYLIRGVFR